MIDQELADAVEVLGRVADQTRRRGMFVLDGRKDLDRLAVRIDSPCCGGKTPLFGLEFPRAQLSRASGVSGIISPTNICR